MDTDSYWVGRRQLVELVAELHPDRYEGVARTIRNLIGNVQGTSSLRRS